MMATYEQLLNLGNSEVEQTTGEDQSIRTTFQGDAATYLTVAWVEDDLFQVACYSPLRGTGAGFWRRRNSFSGGPNHGGPGGDRSDDRDGDEYEEVIRRVEGGDQEDQ